MTFFDAFHKPPIITDIPSACAVWKQLADHFEDYLFATRHGTDPTLCKHYERAVELIKPQTICERLERYAKTAQNLKQLSTAYTNLLTHNRINKAPTAKRAHNAHQLFTKIEQHWNESIQTQNQEQLRSIITYSARQLGPPKYPPSIAEHPQFIAMKRYYLHSISSENVY
jgi:hypothetical protein